jgi:subtilisin family serine protease
VPTRAQRAIARCAREGRGGKGTVIVFAAGNSDRDINDPDRQSLDGFAILPDVIAVAASTSLDERSDYSNYGKEIWICAPSSGAGGWGILTADVTGSTTLNGTTVALGYSPEDYTYEFGGTSSACPLVAGICALLLSIDRDLTAAQVRQIIAETARRIGEQESYEGGRSIYFGHGCVNAEAAVEAVLAPGAGLVAEQTTTPAAA